jgi:WD40 repeat protein
MPERGDFNPSLIVRTKKHDRRALLLWAGTAILLLGATPLQLHDPTKDVEQRNKGLASLRSFSPVCFSPDGHTLLLSRFDPTEKTEAVVWDVDGGKERKRFRWSGASSTTISPDGRMALVDEKGKLTLRDVVTGLDQRTPISELFFASPVVFSQDGKLAAGNQAGILKVWEVSTWKEKGAFPYEEGSHPVDYWLSPDGKTLGAGFLYGSVRVWDVATQKTQAYYPADEKEEVSIRSLSPDLKVAVAQEFTGKKNRDGTVKLWDLATGKKLLLFQGGKEVPNPAEVVSYHFSHDGAILTVGLKNHEGGSEVRRLGREDGSKDHKSDGMQQRVAVSGREVPGGADHGENDPVAPAAVVIVTLVWTSRNCANYPINGS